EVANILNAAKFDEVTQANIFNNYLVPDIEELLDKAGVEYKKKGNKTEKAKALADWYNGRVPEKREAQIPLTDEEVAQIDEKFPRTSPEKREEAKKERIEQAEKEVAEEEIVEKPPKKKEVMPGKPGAKAYDLVAQYTGPRRTAEAIARSWRADQLDVALEDVGLPTTGNKVAKAQRLLDYFNKQEKPPKGSIYTEDQRAKEDIPKRKPQILGREVEPKVGQMVGKYKKVKKVTPKQVTVQSTTGGAIEVWRKKEDVYMKQGTILKTYVEGRPLPTTPKGPTTISHQEKAPKAKEPFKRDQEVHTPEGVGLFQGKGMVVAGEQQYIVEFPGTPGKPTGSFALTDIIAKESAFKGKAKTKKKKPVLADPDRMTHDLLHNMETESLEAGYSEWSAADEDIAKVNNLLFKSMKAQEKGTGTDYVGSTIQLVREGQTFERAYRIERPYGNLIYDAQTGEFSVEVTESIIDELKESLEFEYTAKTGKLIEIVRDNVIKGAPAVVIPNELVQNSMDAIDDAVKMGLTPEGAGNIKIEVGVSPEEGMGSYIKVKDNGKGMTPEELRDKLFVAASEGGKGEEHRGQFGMANIGFLLYPERVEITTVAKDNKGNKVRSKLKADKEDIQFGKLKATTTKAADSARTGTTITLHFHVDDGKTPSTTLYSGFKNTINNTFAPHMSYSLENTLDVGYQPKLLKSFPSFEDLEKVREPVKINFKGSKAVVYFAPAGKYDYKMNHSGPGYKPYVHVYNKGLVTLIDRNLVLNEAPYLLRDKPDFKVLINFEKTPKIPSSADEMVGHENYPFIDNRAKLREEHTKWITGELSPILKEISEETLNTDLENFKKMSAQSPSFGRENVQVLLPFKDKPDMDGAKKLINKNKDVFESFANFASIFNKILTSKLGDKVNVAITVERGVWGFRSKPDMVEMEYVAVNPFEVYLDLLKGIRKLKGDTKIDPSAAAADGSVHAFVHEYVHRYVEKSINKPVEAHGAEFVLELARVYGFIGHDDLSILGDTAYAIYETYAERIESLGKDFKNLGEGGSLVRDSLKTIPSPEIAEGAVQALRADEGRAKEKVTKPTPVPTKTTKEPSVDPGSTKLYSIGGALTEGVKTKLKGKPYETTPADDRMQWDPQDLKLTDKAFWSAKVTQVYQALVYAQAPIRKLARIAKAPLQAKRIEQMVRRLRGIQGALETMLVDHGPFIIGPDGKPRFFVTSKPLGKILSDGLNPVAKRRNDRPEQTYRDYEKMRKSERFVAIYNATKESADTRATKIFPTHTADKQKAQDRSTRAGQAAYKRVQKNIEEAQNDIDRFQRFLALEADANDHIEESGYEVDPQTRKKTINPAAQVAVKDFWNAELVHLETKYGGRNGLDYTSLQKTSKDHRHFEKLAILIPAKRSGVLSKEAYDRITGAPESEYYASFVRELGKVTEAYPSLMDADSRLMGKEAIKTLRGSDEKLFATSVEGTIANVYKMQKAI
ncbi:MAG: ATP-binding protein, partial [Candidatus Thorarchaeota archaeon]